MKGLIFLFLVVALFGITWGYVDDIHKQSFKAVIRKNLLPITLALVIVGFAVVFSLNTTLRFV